MAPRTFAELEALRRPARTSVFIQMDGELQLRQAEARRRVAAARQLAAGAEQSEHFKGLTDPASTFGVEEAEAELEALREQGRDTEVEFVFEAISYAALEELMAAHPPTAKQREQGMVRFNPDTFGPALLAACLKDPATTYEEALRLWGSWSPGQVNLLYQTAWDLCHAVHVVTPFSENGSGPMVPSARS